MIKCPNCGKFRQPILQGPGPFGGGSDLNGWWPDDDYQVGFAWVMPCCGAKTPSFLKKEDSWKRYARLKEESETFWLERGIDAIKVEGFLGKFWRWLNGG